MEGEDDGDLLFRLRIRQAIHRGGGPLEVSRKSGIPVSTLNKYVAMTSIASFTNAAKIAEAAGIGLERLAYGFEGPGAARDVLREVLYMVREVHTEQGMTLPPIALARIVDAHYEAVKRDLINASDGEEITARVHIERQKLLLELLAAKNRPGSGKRSASSS